MRTPAHLDLLDAAHNTCRTLEFVQQTVISDDFQLDGGNNLYLILDLIKAELKRATGE